MSFARGELVNRFIPLDEHGSLTAPLGSHAWAIAVRREVQASLRDSEWAASNLDDYIGVLVEHKGWSQLCRPDGKPFLSMEEFCRTPQPMGLGYSFDAINSIIEERKKKTDAQRAAEAAPLFKHGMNQHSEKGGCVQHTPSIRGTNNPDYELARLKRDAQDDPDKAKLLQQVEAGERTIASAAKEAGIRSPRFSVIISRDRSVIARCILRNLSRYLPPDQVDEIVQMMATTTPSGSEL